jgi:hypothetical protein
MPSTTVNFRDALETIDIQRMVCLPLLFYSSSCPKSVGRKLLATVNIPQTTSKTQTKGHKMAKITVLATSTLWAVLDRVDAGPVRESVGAEGEGEMGAAPPPVIAEGDISAEAAKDVVTVGGALDEVVGELLAMELEGGKDAVIVGGALGEVEGDLSAKELEGRKYAVPVGGVLGKRCAVNKY